MTKTPKPIHFTSGFPSDAYEKTRRTTETPVRARTGSVGAPDASFEVGIAEDTESERCIEAKAGEAKHSCRASISPQPIRKSGTHVFL